ncbi:MAG: pseudouridine synthase [Pseudomonadota bacterium]
MPTVLLNKPFRVLSQFTTDGDKSTLAAYVDLPNVYPAGRLDYDSEGLLVLTSDGQLQSRLAHPRHKQTKTYWVQLEADEASARLCCQAMVDGLVLKDGAAAAISAQPIDEPRLWERKPPVRFRASIPTHWIQIQIDEGRNRQVRRMTAAAGAPTLRLVRISVGPFELGDLAPGEWHELDDREAWRLLKRPARD